MIFIDKTHKVQATKNCVFYSILIEISYSVRETDVNPQIKKMTLMLSHRVINQQSTQMCK